MDIYVTAETSVNCRIRTGKIIHRKFTVNTQAGVRRNLIIFDHVSSKYSLRYLFRKRNKKEKETRTKEIGVQGRKVLQPLKPERQLNLKPDSVYDYAFIQLLCKMQYLKTLTRHRYTHISNM